MSSSKSKSSRSGNRNQAFGSKKKQNASVKSMIVHWIIHLGFIKSGNMEI